MQKMSPSHDHNHHSHAGHTHDHSVRIVDQDGVRRVGGVFALIVSYMFVEIVVGIWVNSLVLIADGVHMLSDALALGLSLVAIYLARRQPDARRSYGYQRAEVLAAFTNGVAMFALSAWIVFEACGRLWAPVAIIPGPMLGVATVGLLINLLAAWILYGGDKDNLNMQGALLHVMGDLLVTVAAIIAGILILLWGWQRADAILSLLAALLILRSAWRITSQSAHMLLEGTPDQIDVDNVLHALEAMDGVREVHDLHVWGLTLKDMIVTAHLVVEEGVDRDGILRDAGVLITQRFAIEHVTLQLESKECLAGKACEQ